MSALAGDGTDADRDGVAPPRVVKLAVREMPGSGKPEQLLDAAGISASHIVAAARRLDGK